MTLARFVRRFVGPFVALCAISASFVAPASASAQRLDRRPGQPGDPAPNRERLERQFRERLADIVRRRLNLNDDQMARLSRTNQRFERERVDLLRQEREARQALRREVLLGDSADQPRISALLDQALRIQRRRLELVEEEQRQLAAFLTPLQRAQYFAIQDELRRRMEDLRQQRRAGQPGGPPRPGRPVPRMP